MKNAYGRPSGLRAALAVGFLWLFVGLTASRAASLWESSASSEALRCSHDISMSAGCRNALRVIVKAASKAVFAERF
jgi:hypothetical protein